MIEFVIELVKFVISIQDFRPKVFLFYSQNWISYLMSKLDPLFNPQNP